MTDNGIEDLLANAEYEIFITGNLNSTIKNFYPYGFNHSFKYE